MKIFVAGAGGAIGRKLTPLLRAVGHTVVGATRSADKADAVRALGAEPVVVDVFDTEALARAVTAAARFVGANGAWLSRRATVLHQVAHGPLACLEGQA
jgi:uncharacterized protein YbjT (DUF2867 family)